MSLDPQIIEFSEVGIGPGKWQPIFWVIANSLNSILKRSDKLPRRFRAFLNLVIRPESVELLLGLTTERGQVSPPRLCSAHPYAPH